MSKRFQKTKEDFVCSRCKTFVSGDGYTNHCPRCLWSKHVDVAPGDRKASCSGMMEPIEVRVQNGEHVIVHKCITCGHTRPNKAAPNDDFDALIEISKKVSRK